MHGCDDGVRKKSPSRQAVTSPPGEKTAISKFADGKPVFFLDVNAKFLATDSTLPREIMPDLLHSNAEGCEIRAGVIVPNVKELLK